MEKEIRAFASLNEVVIRNRASLSKIAAVSGWIEAVVEEDPKESEYRYPRSDCVKKTKLRPTTQAARKTLPMTFVINVPWAEARLCCEKVRRRKVAEGGGPRKRGGEGSSRGLLRGR